MGYALRAGITFCPLSSRTIFLDLVRDRYFCLSPDAQRAFTELAPNSRTTPVALRDAVEAGLIVPTSEPGLPLACRKPPALQDSVFDAEPSTTILQAALMGFRLASALLLLRARSLASIVARIERRKAECANNEDADRLPAIAGALHRTALIASPLDRCLARSIATTHRMLDIGLAPTFCLGVKLGPFEAHSWVQQGSLLVNDTVDQVRRFAPILVI